MPTAQKTFGLKSPQTPSYLKGKNEVKGMGRWKKKRKGGVKSVPHFWMRVTPLSSTTNPQYWNMPNAAPRWAQCNDIVSLWHQLTCQSSRSSPDKWKTLPRQSAWSVNPPRGHYSPSSSYCRRKFCRTTEVVWLRYAVLRPMHETCRIIKSNHITSHVFASDH